MWRTLVNQRGWKWRILYVPLVPLTAWAVIASYGAVQSQPVGTRAASGTAASEALTMERAQTVVHELALNHANPYIRETAYHEFDKDWSIDLEKRTFAVKLHGSPERVWGGKLVPTEGGWATASFDDEAELVKGWVPPADAKLSVEEAQKLLVAMCETTGDAVLQWDSIKKGLAAATFVRGRAVIGRAGDGVEWTVNVEKREFSMRMVMVDVAREYQGKFGWDKGKKWVAWPVSGILTFASNGMRSEGFLVIPDEEK